jgi:hypothetical protein
MSEEIKDLFQRENIRTMKKDLRGLAELETQGKKEQLLNAPKKEKNAVPIPPLNIKMPVPGQAEEKSSVSDASQQLANRFSQIKKEQEEKARIFEERQQKESEGQKTAEQKKKEEEQKEKERLEKALSAAQENIINTAKVPPASSKTAQAPAAATSSSPISITVKTPDPASLKNNPGKEQYKEAVETAGKPEDPKMFAKKGMPFFNIFRPQQKPKDQASQSAAVKQENSKIPSEGSPKKNQEVQLKPADPMPQKSNEKKENIPEGKPAAQPIQAKAINPIDEKEMIRSLDEREKNIDKDLSKISQEKIPVKIRSEEISKEIEKMRQMQLQGILAKEAEVESAIKQLDLKEKSAASADEKRKTEAERQEIEPRREKIEEQRYQVEDSIKSLEAQLNECENNYLRISEKEKKLLKEKADIKNQKEIIILSGKKNALERSLKELNEKTDSLKNGLAAILKEKNELEEKLVRTSKEEQETEAKIEILENQEASTKEPIHLREIEAQRKILAGKRKETEKTRWEAEDQKKGIGTKESEIKKEYQSAVKKIEESSKELKTIEDRLDQCNG